MGPDGAVNIVFKDQIAKADDPVAARAAYIEEYRATFASPLKVAALGYIDAIIEPTETRPRLISALELLANKRQSNPAKKHGNIPL